MLEMFLEGVSLLLCATVSQACIASFLCLVLNHIQDLVGVSVPGIATINDGRASYGTVPSTRLPWRPRVAKKWQSKVTERQRVKDVSLSLRLRSTI